MNPRYPIFIPSKSRADSRLTAKALDSIGVPYHIVVEPQEADLYRAVIDPAKVLVLPFSDRGTSVPARNWIMDYAVSIGSRRVWILDDNIKGFYRLNRNLKVPAKTGSIFRAAEDFVERYENVAITGFHYFMFASRKSKMKPFELNTRVYSNMLIDLNAKGQEGNPYRFRGFYNEDTDICLRMLKDGWCSVLFLAFLAEKSVTMTMRGGNTPVYQGDGRLKMAQELQRNHPDVTRIAWKWGRWQHSVDYRPFKHNLLKRRQEVIIPAGRNEYGMRLQVYSGGNP